ncbi:hypothetical protein D3C85_969730 [compost metagenome]
MTITFSEAISRLSTADLTAINGSLSGLSSLDGGKTWTATLTPTANLNSATGQVSLNTSLISDPFGNSGTGSAVSNSYVVRTLSLTGDPLFRTSDPAPPQVVPNVPLQPYVFTPPTGDLGSPLTFAPLFEQRVLGDGIRPLGDIFINRGALSRSFIAQVFSSSTGGGDGSGHGFLGFGGGDGGVFGVSTLSGLFSRESAEGESELDAFGDHSIQGAGDGAQGLSGALGAQTLNQQLEQLKTTEQRQIDALAGALQQVGISEMQAG